MPIDRHGARVAAATCGALLLFAALVALLRLAEPARAQSSPSLTLTKTVITEEGTTPDSPLQPGDLITYQIVLSYTGGAQPIQTLFTDTLPMGLQPAGSPAIREAMTETVRPLQLQRRGRTIGWKGDMRPEAELIATLPMRIEICYGADRTIRNTVGALRPDGVTISDSVDIMVDCLDASADDVEVTQELVYPGSDADAAAEGAMREARSAFSPNYWVPGVPTALRITLRNGSSGPVVLGWTGCLTCTVASDLSTTTVLQADEENDFGKVALDPGETLVFERPLQLDGPVPDIGDEGEYTYASTVRYCLMGANGDSCADTSEGSDLVGSQTTQFPIRPNDLGDAADSTNHAGSAMSAYSAPAAVAASFPTVFDPATGLPEGPRHVYPQHLHLGQRVSLEAEADIGPDQDSLQNIDPTADSADGERGDDGTNPSAWPLVDCQTIEVPVRVFVNPRALAWFEERDQPAYLNIWLDANRDGDWADAGTCQPAGGAAKAALEQIVIDYPVDVAALGAGTHTVNVPTGVVPWPADRADQEAWVRVTLSERPSNKTLQAGDLRHGDGRGYDIPFRLGETEDYRLTPPGSPAVGADVIVSVQGKHTYTGTAATSGGTDDLWLFQIEYANQGTEPATGISLTFEIPEPVRGLAPSVLSAPDMQPASIRYGPGKINFGIPQIGVWDTGSIVLGWTGCLTCTVVSATGVSGAAAAPTVDSLSASVSIVANNDSDGSNNSAGTTLIRTTLPPRLAVQSDEDLRWSGGGTTCQQSVGYVGTGVPGAAVTLGTFPYDFAKGILREPLTATVQVGNNGLWQHQQSGLPNGSYMVQAGYGSVSGQGSNGTASLRLTVDSSLPADPMSLRITDGAGKTFQPTYAGWPAPLDLVLPPGVYTASIESCANAGVTGISFQIGGQTIPAAQECDDGSDRCGPWSAQFTVPPAVQAAEANAAAPTAQAFGITITSDEAETVVDGTLDVGTGITVRDRSTGEALAGAVVTLYEAVAVTETTGAGSASALRFQPWNGAAFGQPNPQTTGDSGLVALAPPAGTWRIGITLDGYKSFRSNRFTTDGGLLERTLTLRPLTTGAPDEMVEISAAGFDPGVLYILPGSVVGFVNVDLAEHGVRGESGDEVNSGLLTPGERFALDLPAETTLTLSDSTNPLNTVTLIVTNDPPPEEETPETPDDGVNVFLPLLAR